MKDSGITLIEVMIAMTLLITAMTGVSILYIAGQRLVESGLSGADVQRESQVVAERMTRWIRPASRITVRDNWERLEMIVPLSITSDDTVTRSIYYNSRKIYYDSNIADGIDPIEVLEGVYKTRDRVFEVSSNLVDIGFGVERRYLKGPTQPMAVNFKVKIRNVD